MMEGAVHPATPTIDASYGVAQGEGPGQTIHDAVAAARRSARGRPKAALLLVAGTQLIGRLDPATRASLSGAAVAGATVAGILTDTGIVKSGAAVVCFSGDAVEASASCAGEAVSPRDAAERVGRLILAGSQAPHHPRGLALAFASTTAGSPGDFLDRWRQIVGPRLRTVISVTAGTPFYGSGGDDPGALVVLSLEGRFQTSLGVAPGVLPGESLPDVHAAAEATAATLERLRGHSVRAVLVAENAGRHAALGVAAHEEWALIRERVGAGVPCLGWLTTEVGRFGAGWRSGGGGTGSLVVVLAEAQPTLAHTS